MSRIKEKLEKRVRRRKRVRAAIKGTSDCPRLSVFRSNRHISAQLIDDAAGITLAFASDDEIAKNKKKSPRATGRRASLNRLEQAQWVGERIAEKAGANGIRRAHFDRGHYRYHGLVKALAEAARKGGLHF